jgi:hypothetical protein
MVSLAGIIGNNSIGYAHKHTKVNRAIKRSAGRLLEKAFSSRTRTEYFDLGKNKFLEVVWGTPDLSRLQQCFDRIARALFFSGFAHKFIGHTQTLLGYVNHSEPNSAAFLEFMKHKVEMELRGIPIGGENPDVFQYQFTDLDSLGLRTLRMCFYGGLNVYVALIPEGLVLPTNLSHDLIANGVRTSIRLEDALYEFNK